MGLIKGGVVGFILILQKSASNVLLSIGAWFIIMLARVSVFARIDMSVRSLLFSWDLSFSCLKKFVIVKKKELSFWSGMFLRALKGSTISWMPITLSMLYNMFKTGRTWGHE